MKKAALLCVLLIMVLALTLTPSSAQSTADPTWVKMLGYINSYGEDVAWGLLRAHAEVEEWARVHAFYVPGLNFSELKIPREIPTNFTVSFHAVRLVNATEVELNYEGNDLYISGLWDVYNVTFVYYSWQNFTLTTETLVNNGVGELNVTGTWTEFTLAITNIELIGGKVARNYEFTPETPTYDFNMDFNFDFKTNIYDPVETTVFAQMLATETSQENSISFSFMGIYGQLTFPEEAYPGDMIAYKLYVIAGPGSIHVNYFKLTVSLGLETLYKETIISDRSMSAGEEVIRTIPLLIPSGTYVGRLYCSIEAETYKWLTTSYGASNLYTTYIRPMTYNELYNSYNSSAQEYSNLSSKYNKLKSNYNSLKDKYDTLKSEYDDLESEYGSLTDNFDTTRNLNYAFIVTTMIFIGTTAYFVRRRKVEPEFETT